MPLSKSSFLLKCLRTGAANPGSVVTHSYFQSTVLALYIEQVINTVADGGSCPVLSVWCVLDAFYTRNSISFLDFPETKAVTLLKLFSMPLEWNVSLFMAVILRFGLFMVCCISWKSCLLQIYLCPCLNVTLRPPRLHISHSGSLFLAAFYSPYCVFHFLHLIQFFSFVFPSLCWIPLSSCTDFLHSSSHLCSPGIHLGVCLLSLLCIYLQSLFRVLWDLQFVGGYYCGTNNFGGIMVPWYFMFLITTLGLMHEVLSLLGLCLTSYVLSVKVFTMLWWG